MKINHLQKLQFQTKLDQKMVSINYLQIPIYMHFLVELEQRTFICLMNVNMNYHNLVYTSITYPYFLFVSIINERIHLELT